METSADRLFANAAMEAGYLEEKQVAELLEEAGKAGTPLSKLCREKKTITPKQVRLSLEAAFEALKKEDEELASLVVENDLADEESITLATEEQENTFEEERVLPPRIGEILVSMEVVNEEQLASLKNPPAPEADTSGGSVASGQAQEAEDSEEEEASGQTEEEKLASEKTPVPEEEASEEEEAPEQTEEEKLASEKTPVPDGDTSEDRVASGLSPEEDISEEEDAPESGKKKKRASRLRAVPAPKGAMGMVTAFPSTLKKSIGSLKDGLGQRKQLAAITAERDRILLKLGHVVIEAGIKCPEADTAIKAQKNLESIQKRRGKKQEATLRIAETKRDFTTRKLGRYAVTKPLDLEGDEDNIKEVRRLDAGIEALGKNATTPVQMVIREKPILVAAGLLVLSIVLLSFIMSMGGLPPLPPPTTFAIVDAARDFNSVRPWDDLDDEERASIQEEIPQPEIPEPLPEDEAGPDGILNARGRIFVEKLEAVRKSINASTWEEVSLTEALLVLAKQIDILDKLSPKKELSTEEVPHPQVTGYGAAHRTLLDTLTARKDIYATRLSYLRLRSYSEALGALKRGNHQECLDKAWEFETYDPGEELQGLAKSPLYESFREQLMAAPPEVVAAARSLIQSLKRYAIPTTAEMAILMYKAKDFDREVPAEGGIESGKWAAFEGEYTMTSTGGHLLHLGETNFVVFYTDKSLTETPKSTRMRIVGIFDGIKERPTADGKLTLCPVLDDCLVFKQD